MRKVLATLLCVFLVMPGLTACGPASSRYEAEFLTLFDTVTRIVAYAPDEEEFTRFARFVYDGLNQYHELYDIYHDYEGISNIKTINDSAGVAPVRVDRRIIDLLIFAKEQFKATGGQTNVALGAVLRIWHGCREAGIDDPEHARLPSAEELKEAARHTDIDDVVIDEEASTVYLRDPLMSLDVGAVAKGYAAEQVCRQALEAGYTSGLLSVGGNVRALGEKSGGEPWNVGIRNPGGGEEDPYIRILSIRGMSVVTSGIYERYYTVDGFAYHHIIDPDTLFPSAYYASVTIVCLDSGLADSLSTAVFCMPPDEARAYIGSLPGVEALWVLPDGTIETSGGFPAYVKE